MIIDIYREKGDGRVIRRVIVSIGALLRLPQPLRWVILRVISIFIIFPRYRQRGSSTGAAQPTKFFFFDRVTATASRERAAQEKILHAPTTYHRTYAAIEDD